MEKDGEETSMQELIIIFMKALLPAIRKSLRIVVSHGSEEKSEIKHLLFEE